MTEHTPFLKQVAQIFAENEKDDLKNICFIFPNKRSATFFKHYIGQFVTDRIVNAKTISAFISDFSK
ncbi:MAG: hypothetical protein K2M11_07505, partial [Paramuribaculum sp.]|nr:hypothetical protein [Paramuribaculum sp.]